jgi:hypothetical protein
LFEFVCTLHSPRRFSRRLYSGQQKRDQNADDCDDDKEFDKRKTEK